MLYIGTDEGIFRWFPGSPWPIFHSLQNKRVVQLAAASDGVLAALDGSGQVWETTNNGLSWRSIPRPETAGRPTRLILAGFPPRLVLAMAGPLALYDRRVGLRLESDESPPAAVALARKWMPSWMSQRGGTATARRKRAAPAEDRKRHGWRPLKVPEIDLVGSLNGFEVLDSGAGGDPWLGSIVGGGLWRSDDEGQAWSRASASLPDVTCLRRSGKDVIAGTSQGVWSSSDGGQTWNERSAGLEPARRIRAVAMRPGKPQVLLAGVIDHESSVCSLYESKDGGASWKHVARGFPVRLENNSIIDIRHDLADAECCVVAAESGAMWRTQTDGLWWEPLARPMAPARVLCAVE
jgi:photosystem II stability/assembly factor-like uncharacterized protein